jgi:hypothetical protein
MILVFHHEERNETERDSRQFRFEVNVMEK